MSNIKEIIIGWFIVLLLLFNILTIPISTSIPSTSEYKQDISEIKYTIHAPIRINGDSDFEQQVASEGWDGNGSADNPYIIRGYTIDGNEYGYGVYIGNTTVHFTVKNCQIHDALGNNGQYFRDSGIYLYNVTNGTLSYNLLVDNSAGIYLDTAEGNLISNNRATKFADDNAGPSLMALTQMQNGIYMYDAANNRIINNTLENGNTGLIQIMSSYNAIENNTFLNNTWGSQLYTNSDYNIFTNNQIARNKNGLQISRSSHTELSKNNVSSNDGNGFYMFASHQNLIQNNTFYRNGASSVFLYHAIANTLSNNSMYAGGVRIHGTEIKHWVTHKIDKTNQLNGKPVYYWTNKTDSVVPLEVGQVILANCTRITVEDQNVSDAYVGILLGFSNENRILNNSIRNNSRGIDVYYSNNNIIENNYIINGSRGVNTFRSSGNVLKSNIVSDTFSAIFISNSKRTRIFDNKMMSGGIMIAGGTLDNWNTHEIDIKNTVNEKPVYYFKNITGGDIGSKAGQIILANCSGFFIDDHNIYQNDAGIILAYSNKNVISNVSVVNSSRGIYLMNSNDNKFESNNVSHNTYGIYMANSYGNTWCRNNIYNNTIGSYILSSSDNIIFHNNFINNTRQTYESISSLNEWSVEYPFGGNYWSDYEGVDEKSGHDQDENGPDGIGDLPYEIIDEILDDYPLMEPFAPLNLSVYLPEKYAVLNTDQVTIEWSSSGGIGPKVYSIRITNDSWIEIGSSTQYILSNLSEGEYAVEVLVEDNTGCNITDNVFFTVDVAPPNLDIIYPCEGDIIVRRNVTVEWYGEDPITGIMYYEIRWDDGEWDNIGLNNTYPIIFSTDGEHTVEVRAWDNVGHNTIKKVSFIVETSPPYLNIISPKNESIITHDDVTIEWICMDNITGISHIEVRLDKEEWVRVGKNLSHSFMNLTEGDHIVDIRAWNIAKHHSLDSVNFYVDITPPNLNITYPKHADEFTERNITIRWNISDVISGIARLEIRIDGEEWIEIGENTSHEFRDLNTGQHIVEVRTWDRAGHGSKDSVMFRIYEEKIEEDETDVPEERERDERSTILLIVIMVGALVLMVLLTLTLINAYKTPEESIDGNWHFKE